MKKTAFAALLLGATTTTAHADGIEVDHRGVTLEEGPVTLNLGGRVHFDAAVFDDPATGDSSVTDADFRRARLEFSGRIAEVVRFRIDREFAGGSKGWRNLWLEIAPAENIELRGGNTVAPFSAEDLQSSNSLPFAERSLASALSPGYGLGGMASANGKHWSASLGWFTDALDNEDRRSAERGRGFVGRVTVLPVSHGKTRLHLGLGGEHRTFRTGEVLRLSADAGSILAPNAMTSGSLTDIRRLDGWNGEAGLSLGPVLVQGQVLGFALSRTGAPDLNFNGQTVQAAWLVTGGRYGYSRASGNFSGLQSKRGKMALEIALRYSRLDMADGAFDRGVGEAITGGANWYIGRNLRFMVDYTHSSVDFAGLTPDRTNDVGLARLQINY